MKTLYLVRHAEAIARDAESDDVNRTLTKRGENDAQEMSLRLKKKGLRPELLLLSSPAERSLATAQIFAETLAYPRQQIVLKEEFYQQDASTLLSILKETDDAYTTVILFGHNPAISGLAKNLLPHFEAELRKGGIVGMIFDVSSWQQIGAESATLLFFDFPVRIMSKVYQKTKTVLKQQITAKLTELLEQLDVRVSKQVARLVKKASKKLAKDVVRHLDAPKVEDLAGARKYARVDQLPPDEVCGPDVSSAAQPPTEAPVERDVTESSTDTPAVAAVPKSPKRVARPKKHIK